MPNVRIGNLDRDGVRKAMEWAEAEGWGPGLTDWRPFYEADRSGFFFAGRDGRTVATLSVVKGSAEAAFVGLYIVDPDLRGRGIGRALWDEVLGRFAGITLGLDAVPEQVETYAGDGFTPAHGNTRYAGEAAALPRPKVGQSVRPASDVSFHDLVSFDGEHFFGPRPGFLREWVRGSDRNAVVTIDQGNITGFAASRETSTGHRIGPVFTDDPAAARDMVLTLAADLSGPVSVDVPDSNRVGVELFTSLGLEPGFRTTRMYRGDPPDLPLDSIFGITSLELG